MPWDDAEVLRFPFIPPQKKLWRDPSGLLKLSTQQKRVFHSWARPYQILSMRGKRADTKTVMIKKVTPYSITQKYVTDCSFIARYEC